MANSDYTSRPGNHGFCPVGFLTADIGPLDSAVTMSGYTSPVADGIRVGMAAMIASIIPSDPYSDSVSLLIQDEAAGGTTLTNKAVSGGTAAVTSGLVWDNGLTHLGGNTLHATEATPTVASFQSSGIGSRFTRPSGESMTVEVWVRWTTLPNFSTSGTIWYWKKTDDVDRLGNLFFSGDAGALVYRVSGTSYTLTTLSANTWHFVQVTTIGNTFYVDVDGTQYATGPALPSDAAGTYDVYVASQISPSSTAADFRIGSLRWTKGVARPRGTVPTEPFLSSATAFTQEIVVVTAQSGNDLTLGRGCCDTVPAEHSAGDAIWFFDDSLGSDKIEYAGTETIGVKVVPRVTAGSLPIEHAPAAELEFNLRFARPYPPGLVEVNGAPWFTTPLVLDSGTPTLGLTWAHRDRVTQQDQLIDHLEANIGPETGTTYEIRVYRATGAIVRTVTGLTGTSWDYTLAEATADFSAAGDEYPGYITLNSARDGLLSFQEYRIDFTLDSDGVSVADDALTVTVSLPIQPAAVSIALAHTQAATPASPGGSLVRFFTPALILAEPVPAGQTFTINFGERSNNAGPIYYLAQYQTTEPTTRATIVAALRQQIEYLLVNTTSPALSDFIDIVTVSDYSGSKWLHLVGKFGIEFMAEGTGQPDPPGVSRPFVTGSNTSMLSWANGAAVVPVALPQIITATLTGSPAAGDRCTITLNGTAFSHTSLTSESADAVATALAALIDADPNYAAAAVGAVVTIDGLTAANVFAYSATSESLFAF